MEKAEVEELREKSPAGPCWKPPALPATDKKAHAGRSSTAAATIHDGKGWFDPLSDAKGDVFRLAEHLDAFPFSAAIHVVADLIGFTPFAPPWNRQAKERGPDQTIAKRWQNCRKPWPGRRPGGISATSAASLNGSETRYCRGCPARRPVRQHRGPSHRGGWSLRGDRQGHRAQDSDSGRRLCHACWRPMATASCIEEAA